MMTHKLAASPVYVFLLAVVSAFIFFFQLGQGSLTSWDEAIYGVISREMLRSGHWLKPTYIGALWLEKPPFCFWMTALSYKLFGINEFGVRFFSALAGFGTALATYFLGSKMFNRWIGFLSGMFLITSKHFPRHARRGMTDGPLVFFVSLALLFFWLGRKKNVYFCLSGVALGLAFLVKGVAAVFVILITWIYCWWAGELFILKKPAYWLGILICGMIVLPWNLYEWLVFPDVFKADLYSQIFLRITQGLHAGDWGYYLEVLASKYRPWVILVVLALPFFIFKTFRTRSKEMIFISVWIFFVFASVTLMATKLQWYLLPIYPALSICVAYAFAKVIKEKYFFLVLGMFLITMIGHAYDYFFKLDFNPDLKSISPSVKQIVPRSALVFLYPSIERHASVFYTERTTSTISNPEEFASAAGRSDFYCLIDEKILRESDILRTNPDLIVRASAGKLVLLSRK